MSKTANISSKRLIGTNPAAWAQWATDIPDLQCLGIESSSFEWVSRQTDVLLRVRSPQYGNFLIVNEIQTRYISEILRRMRSYAALAEEKYSLPVYPMLVNLFPPSGDREIPKRYQS